MLEGMQDRPSGGKRRKAGGDSDTGPITEGGRNSTLTSLAGTMRRRGMGGEAIEAALLAENESRCTPPLADQEVRAIAASVGRYLPAAIADQGTPGATPSLLRPEGRTDAAN